MEKPAIVRRAIGMRWQAKAIIPVVGVLLLALVAAQVALSEEAFANRHWILIVLVSGAVILCFVLLSVLLVLVERPLSELKRTIQRVRDGDLGARLGFAEREDDIGELGRQFNEMVEELKKTRAEIQRLHEIEMQRAEHLATTGELAAGLAHEIRNPLAGIAGVVEVMGKELPAASASRAVLGDVQAQIHRIQAILNDLLAYARPRPPHFQASDLNATVEQAVLLAREQVRTKPIEIGFVAESTLPLVTHDAAQMQQVVLNLVLNGIQAIDGGGRVDVRLRREPRAAVMTIEDTGRGIKAEELSRIFKPFFTTRKEGTGLGLSLAKGIVEAHGGRIGVSSTVGRGTRFEVQIPVERGAGGPA
jgi:signal transduction histidine kinase